MFTNLKQRRVELGLTQQQAAEFIGISKKSYSNYEYKNMGPHNPIAQKIIASGILGSTNAEEIKKQFREEKRRERNKYRIPNVPNFYERLNSLCDKDGKINVDSNHPMLQDLREAVGGERYMEKKAYDN